MASKHGQNTQQQELVDDDVAAKAKNACRVMVISGGRLSDDEDDETLGGGSKNQKTGKKRIASGGASCVKGAAKKQKGGSVLSQALPLGARTALGATGSASASSSPGGSCILALDQAPEKADDEEEIDYIAVLVGTLALGRSFHWAILCLTIPLSLLALFSWLGIGQELRRVRFVESGCIVCFLLGLLVWFTQRKLPVQQVAEEVQPRRIAPAEQNATRARHAKVRRGLPCRGPRHRGGRRRRRR